MSQTEYRYRTLIVVPAADQDEANLHAAELGGPADLETFTGGLSPTGAPPATHYVCASAFTSAEREQVEALRAAFPDAVLVDYDLDTEPERPEAVLAGLGLRRVVVEGS